MSYWIGWISAGIVVAFIVLPQIYRWRRDRILSKEQRKDDGYRADEDMRIW
jgi:uncharacterized membrane protein